MSSSVKIILFLADIHFCSNQTDRQKALMQVELYYETELKTQQQTHTHIIHTHYYPQDI